MAESQQRGAAPPQVAAAMELAADVQPSAATTDAVVVGDVAVTVAAEPTRRVGEAPVKKECVLIPFRPMHSVGF